MLNDLPLFIKSIQLEFVSAAAFASAYQEGMRLLKLSNQSSIAFIISFEQSLSSCPNAAATVNALILSAAI